MTGKAEHVHPNTTKKAKKKQIENDHQNTQQIFISLLLKNAKETKAIFLIIINSNTDETPM